MENSFDILIIGAGPSGCVAAAYLSNKKFEIKASDAHPSVVKVPKKKKGKKMYFDLDVQEAIVRYNTNPDNHALRNKIYGEEIHRAFDKFRLMLSRINQLLSQV